MRKPDSAYTAARRNASAFASAVLADNRWLDKLFQMPHSSALGMRVVNQVVGALAGKQWCVPGSNRYIYEAVLDQEVMK